MSQNKCTKLVSSQMLFKIKQSLRQVMKELEEASFFYDDLSDDDVFIHENKVKLGSPSKLKPKHGLTRRRLWKKTHEKIILERLLFSENRKQKAEYDDEYPPLKKITTVA